MGTYYAMKEELNQEKFYQFIHRAGRYGYKVVIDTDIEKLGIGDVDEETLETCEEMGSILCDGSIYEQIGFLMMENIKVDKLQVIKKEFMMSIYPSCVYLNGDLEEMKKCFGYCGFNPNWWIGDEQKH